VVETDEPDVVSVILGHLPFHVPLVLLAGPEQAPVLDVDVVVWKVEIGVGEGALEDQRVCLGAPLVDIAYSIVCEVIGNALLRPTSDDFAS